MNIIYVRLLVVFFAFLGLELFSSYSLLGLTTEPPISTLDFEVSEVSSQVNLINQHTVTNLEGKLAPWINAIGASVAVVDYNNDGWSDIFVTNSGMTGVNRLFKNSRGEFFQDVTNEAGLSFKRAQPFFRKSIFFDCDNDGYKDLFVFGYCPKFFKNQKGKFKDHTSESGLTECFHSVAGNVLDINSDGLLDLVYASYEPGAPDHPLNSEYVGRVRLYENMGSCQFQRRLDPSLKEHPYTISIGVVDLDNSGTQDLWFAKDYGTDKVFLTQKNGELLDVSEKLGKSFSRHGMSSEMTYLPGEEHPSVFVSHIFMPSLSMIEGNSLWSVNKNNKFKNVARKWNVERCGHAWGSKFFDINRDTLSDLIVVNGFISSKEGKDYTYNIQSLFSSSRRMMSNFNLWPDMRGALVWGNERNCLFFGKEDHFVNVTNETVLKNDTYDGRGVATIDYKNDGGAHFVIANQKGPLKLYQVSQKNNNHWFGLKLEGRCSNRDAFGTIVEVFLTKKKLKKYYQPTNGSFSQSHSRLIFGLGKNKKVEKVQLTWPSGQVDEYKDLKADRYYDFKESKNCSDEN